MSKAHPAPMGILRKSKPDDDDLIIRDPSTGAPAPRLDPVTGLPVWLAERVLTAPQHPEALAADVQLQTLRAAVDAAVAELVELRKPLDAVQDHKADLDAMAAEIAARPGRIHALEQILPARRRAVLARELEVLQGVYAALQPDLAQAGADVQDAIYDEQVVHMKVERASWRASVLGNQAANVGSEISTRRTGLDEIDAKHGWA